MFRQDKSAVKDLINSVPNNGDKKGVPTDGGDTFDFLQLSPAVLFLGCLDRCCLGLAPSCGTPLC